MGIIADNYNSVKDELEGFQGRVVAVSKYVGVDEIQQAYEAGVRDFGENKAQSALAKMKELPSEIADSCCWHFIGHLQSNKAAKVVGNFDYIHSVDTLKLAKKISELACKKGLTQKILLQVNVAGEESKSGFSQGEIAGALSEITQLSGVSVEGLMLMAPFCDDEDYLRSLFEQMRNLKFQLEQEFDIQLKELSMGMSNDYRVAVGLGSTMVRIGTKIFNRKI